MNFIINLQIFWIFLILCLSIFAMIALYCYRKLFDAWYKANKIYLRNAPKEYLIEKDKKYIGVFVTTTNLNEEKYDFVYGSGVILFIEYLIKKKQPFRLITDVNEKNFSELVKDTNCENLYIVGHGRRYGLIIGKSKDEMIYYKQFKDAGKKRKVVQLHCNHCRFYDKHYGEKSLTEYLDAELDFKQNKMRYHWNNIKYFSDKLDEK